jgi:organic radical activating enzyme
VGDLNFAGYVTWTGGEPFLSFESLKTGLWAASGRGFKSEILTSGTWFHDHPSLLDEIAAIKDVSIRISVDAEHQRSVADEELVRLLEQAEALGLEANLTLREIPGDDNAVKRTIAALQHALPQFVEKKRHQSRFFHTIPHMPVRDPRQPGQDSQELNPKAVKWKKPCTLAFRDLVVGEDGVVYPCCGVIGLSKRDQFAVGDPLELTGHELLRIRNQHPLLSRLRCQGPYQMAKDKGLEPDQWGIHFATPCHLCLTLLTYFPEVY